jgi:hypothetical protein
VHCNKTHCRRACPHEYFGAGLFQETTYFMRIYAGNNARRGDQSVTGTAYIAVQK